MIRTAVLADAAAILDVNNHYIENTTVSFEVGFKFGRWLDVGYWELLL